MIIKNTEKQILQKHYAEKIKSWAQNLKDIIQQDDQEKLANHILDIKEACKRICVIQNDWRADSQRELERLENVVEEGYKNGK